MRTKNTYIYETKVKIIYHCLTSDLKEINIKSDTELFISELTERAGRNDLMLLSIEKLR